MSGGRFDYKQFQLNQLADDIERIIKKNGVTLDLNEARVDKPWITRSMVEEDPSILTEYNYKPETLQKFKDAYRLLRTAFIYLHRIDWMISDDDSEGTFHQRLKTDLEALDYEIKMKQL